MIENPLGKQTTYPEKYSPLLLYPISRWPSRSLLDIDKRILMYGFDYWRAYELSWLNKKGKPQTAVGEFLFDARSENMVESKSLKLYLNSLNNERFKDNWEVARIISRDLTRISQSEVTVDIKALNDPGLLISESPDGFNLDALDIEISASVPDANLLQTTDGQANNASLLSDAFRSNCPMTGQPDWASIVVTYSGPMIDEESLLRYLCSFRMHSGYHEECVEIMYRDIMLHCQPDHLLIGLNFTRRGGLEINPYRSNVPVSPADFGLRFVRQ